MTQKNMSMDVGRQIALSIQTNPVIFFFAVILLGFPTFQMSSQKGVNIVLQLLFLISQTYFMGGLYSMICQEVCSLSLPNSFIKKANKFFIDLFGVIIILLVLKYIFNFAIFIPVAKVLESFGFDLKVPSTMKTVIFTLIYITFSILTMYCVPVVFALRKVRFDCIFFSLSFLKHNVQKSLPIAFIIVLEAIILLQLPVNFPVESSELLNSLYVWLNWGIKGAAYYIVFLWACHNIIVREAANKSLKKEA